MNQDVYDNASNDGSWGHIGVSLSYNTGPWLVAGALSGGKGKIDTDRNLNFNGFSGKAEGDQHLSYAQGKLRSGYLVEMGQWYVKPLVDLDAIWMSYGDVRENGGNGAGLSIGSGEQTVLSVTPRLELGGRWEISNGAAVLPYVQGGAAFYTGTGFSLDSAFLDAPPATPSFRTEAELDDVLAQVSAGVDVMAVENLKVRLSYDGLFGSTLRSNAGTLRVDYHF
jgi:uncharacterized protein with beta-barrel porin domain